MFGLIEKFIRLVGLLLVILCDWLVDVLYEVIIWIFWFCLEVLNVGIIVF